MSVFYVVLIQLFSFISGRATGCSKHVPREVQFGKVTKSLELTVEDPLNYLGVRHYSLFIPSSYEHTKRAKFPVVFDFHGYYDDSQSEAHEDHFHQIAESENVIVVYPDAFDDAIYQGGGWRRGWNGEGSMGTPGKYGRICHEDHDWYPCFRSCMEKDVCSLLHPSAPNDCHCSSCVNDLEYIRLLFEWMQNHFCIDETQIHGTAISMGAIFLYYLTTLPEDKIGFRFNSIVPVAGSFYFGHLKHPKSPVAVLDLHGLRDNTVPMNASFSINRFHNFCPVLNTTRLGCAVGDDLWYYHTKEQILPVFARSNGCTTHKHRCKTRPNFDGYDGLVCHEFLQCPEGSEVVHCNFNGGHNWPFHIHRKKPNNDRGRKFAELAYWFMFERNQRPTIRKTNRDEFR